VSLNVIPVHPLRQADIVGINAIIYCRFYSKQK
jgi:hypothetical protein